MLTEEKKPLVKTLMVFIFIWMLPLLLMFQVEPYLTDQESLLASCLVSSFELVALIVFIPFVMFEYLVYRSVRKPDSTKPWEELV